MKCVWHTQRLVNDNIAGMITDNPQCRNELERIVAEAESHSPGAGTTLQEVLHADTINQQQFLHDKTGNRGNKWSLVTYRIGKLYVYKYIYTVQVTK